MKLILVNSLSNGGGERIAANVANEICKTEKVMIVILENEITYIVDSRVNIISLKKSRLLPYLNQILQIKKLILTYKVNFIQSHLYRSNFINILCKLLGSKHFCQVVNHGDPSQYLNKGPLGLIMYQLVKILYPKADQIISISELMAITLKKVLPSSLNNNSIKVVNNPYDITNIISQSELLSTTSFPLPKKYLVFMGRLIPSKNIELLFDAVKKMKLPLVIIGTGSLENELKAYAVKLQIENYIFFIGQLNNPFPIIKNAIAFVSASKTEGFPNSIIESLACSVPVIHSDCISGPREILQPNSDSTKLMNSNNFEKTPYGALYTTNNLNTLVLAISYVVYDVIDIDTMKKNCRARAFDFDSSNIVKQYFE